MHQIAHIGVSPRMNFKLFGRENYFRIIPTCVKNIPERHGETDERTDRRLTVDDRALHRVVNKKAQLTQREARDSLGI